MGAKVAFLGSDVPTQTAEMPAGVAIARDALRTDAAGDFVWRLRNGVVDRRSVEVGGARDRDRVLITSGLASGDTVVSSAAAELTAGQKVRTE